MRKILSALLEKLQYNEDVSSTNTYNLTVCLRQEAAKWACLFNDPSCIKEATFQLEKHLSNRTLNK